MEKIKQLKESEKIELWIFTGAITLALLFSVLQTINARDSITGNLVMGISWLGMLFNYLTTCICYLLLFFYVESELAKTDRQVSNAVFFVYILITACFFMGFIDFYFGILLSIKILIIYFKTEEQREQHKFGSELTILFACWLFILSGMAFLNVNIFLRVYTAFVVPIALLHYLYDVYTLLPEVMPKRRPFLRYLGTTFLITVLSFIPLGLLSAIAFADDHTLVLFSGVDISQNTEQLVGIPMGLNFLTQLIIVPLFAWNIYKARTRKNAEEIKTLKTELGKSDANLNFLKSQINPHFLFNALNTLYGTALQENAERTGEGIQKLGDMMRFMLQENIEDKILLSRDVDYLNNYIALQKLRTLVSSSITIETQIEVQNDDLQIAPMLLIPFVENAFKHGISLQNPSHIKITLQTSENKLYFDVHNSIHLKGENDPERLQSGIGLQNVKQRLALLYPNRHELIIRENAKEFFIHLTLQLDVNH